MNEFVIRAAQDADWPAVWQIFHTVVAQGDTYAFDPATTEETARQVWWYPTVHPFVAEQNGSIVAMYMLKTNQPGLGNHVVNAGYMVDPQVRGRGIASRLCTHSMETARHMGYQAMQYNFVVSTNTVAIRLWERHGFTVVGRVPKAFRHAQIGLTDVLVMHRFL